MIFHFVCLSISFSIPSVFICCLFHITVNASLVEPNYGNDNDANDNEESSYSPVANTNDGTHLGIKRHRKKDHNHNKLTKSSKKKNKHKTNTKTRDKGKSKKKNKHKTNTKAKGNDGPPAKRRKKHSNVRSDMVGTSSTYSFHLH